MCAERSRPFPRGPWPHRASRCIERAMIGRSLFEVKAMLAVQSREGSPGAGWYVGAGGHSTGERPLRSCIAPSRWPGSRRAASVPRTQGRRSRAGEEPAPAPEWCTARGRAVRQASQPVTRNRRGGDVSGAIGSVPSTRETPLRCAIAPSRWPGSRRAASVPRTQGRRSRAGEEPAPAPEWCTARGRAVRQASQPVTRNRRGGDVCRAIAAVPSTRETPLRCAIAPSRWSGSRRAASVPRSQGRRSRAGEGPAPAPEGMHRRRPVPGRSLTAIVEVLVGPACQRHGLPSCPCGQGGARGAGGRR